MKPGGRQCHKPTKPRDHSWEPAIPSQGPCPPPWARNSHRVRSKPSQCSQALTSASDFSISCCCLVSKSDPLLCDRMGCTPPAPLSVEFSRREYQSGLPLPSPADLPGPGIEPESPAWRVASLLLSLLGRLSITCCC